LRTVEPEQIGERRLEIRKEGTTAYLKVGFHAPGTSHPHFFPLLVLDAVLTGAKGVNLWSSFRIPPPQRRSRLYRALVDTGLASQVSGAMLPTAEPFLYTLSATVTEGTSIATVRDALLEAVERVRESGITPEELRRAQAQLKARFVFDSDSVTNIAHQLGYFATVASVDVFAGLMPGVDGVTLEQVAAAGHSVLRPSNRTVGWFDPLPLSS
jgi:zinc protease